MSIASTATLTADTPWRVVTVEAGTGRPEVNYMNAETRRLAREAKRKAFESSPTVIAWVEQYYPDRGNFGLWLRAR